MIKKVLTVLSFIDFFEADGHNTLKQYHITSEELRSTIKEVSTFLSARSGYNLPDSPEAIMKEWEPLLKSCMAYSRDVVNDLLRKDEELK